MTTYVAFLRAVNLGRRRAPSARLVQITEGLGHRHVRTYVNSGNVIFEADGPAPSIERDLEEAYGAGLGFEATTFVRTTAELERTLAGVPFPVEDRDTYFITFLKDRLDRAGAETLESLSNGFDTLVVSGREVHWRMRGRSTDSQLRTRQWDDIAGRLRTTSRNTTMLRKLVARAASPG